MTNDQKYIFGIKSKFGEFLFKYPWYSMIILFSLLEVITFLIERNINELIPPIKIVLPLFVVITAIVQVLSKTYSYKVILDTKAQNIIFYLMFNRGEHSEQIHRDIKVIVDHNEKIIINGKTYVVFAEILHDLVSLLPKETEVTFKGIFGKFKEKDWKRANRQLKPGNNITNY